MATKVISHAWKLKLPNAFLVDHSFSDGKTRDVTYDGPDKIYLQIGADGTELYGPITEDDIADGRPKPADVVQWFEVDCAANDTNTLICQLRGPVIDEKEEERGTGSVIHPGSPDVGSEYPRLSYSLPLMADDIYDVSSIKVSNPGTASAAVTIGAFTHKQKLNGPDLDKTWAHVRTHRNQVLEQSDGNIAEDMPTSMKDEWKAYRQKLRDFPKTMEDAGVHPNIADMMFPNPPGFTDPPDDPADDATEAEKWAPPG